MQIARSGRRSLGLIALCLTIVGCGASSRGGNAAPSKLTATSAPTATVISPMPLAWHGVTSFPQGYAGVSPGTAIAESDGNTALVCSQDQTSKVPTVQIWITRNRGASWARGGDVPSVPHSTCAIVFDHANAANIVIKILQYPPPYPFATRTRSLPFSSPGVNEQMDYASFDAGQHWELIPNGIFVDEWTSTPAGIYARIGTAAAPDANLALSRDQLRSWHKLNPPNAHPMFHPFAASIRPASIRAGGGNGYQSHFIWADPFTSAVLYASNETTDQSLVLALSFDGGVTWHTLTPPATITQLVARPSVANQQTQLCALGDNFWCSPDMGQTWTERFVGKQLDPSRTVVYPALVGIATNGDLIAIARNGVQAELLYRLAPGATYWQTLGPAPDGVVQVSEAPPGDLLWGMNYTASSAFPVWGHYVATYS